MRWIYWDKNVNSLKENTEALLVASKEGGLQVNAVQMKTMLCNILWWRYVGQLTTPIIIQDLITLSEYSFELWYRPSGCGSTTN
jgi:hypothetical protein